MWTFAYDVSGISSVTFSYRQDKDGINPQDDFSNEVYKSGRPATLSSITERCEATLVINDITSL